MSRCDVGGADVTGTAAAPPSGDALSLLMECSFAAQRAAADMTHHAADAAHAAAPAAPDAAPASPLSPTVAEVASLPPPQPEALIGRRVLRTFSGASFEGAVTSTRATRAYGQLWHVRYDDDDEEDLGWTELRGALRPADASSTPEMPRALQMLLPAGVRQPAVADGAPRGGTHGGGGDGDSDSDSGCEGDGDSSGGAAAHAFPPPPPSHTAAEAAPPAQRYKGVRRLVLASGWERFCGAAYAAGGSALQHWTGTFSTALEAARARDDAARQLGRTDMNFPRPGSAEVQAAPRLRAAAAAPGAHASPPPLPPPPLPPPPPPSSPPDEQPGTEQPAPPVRHAAAAAAAGAGGEYFRGVKLIGQRWRACVSLPGNRGVRVLGLFDTAADAARAYDAAARQLGKLEFNFPQPGTREARAVFGQWTRRGAPRPAAATQPAPVARPSRDVPALGMVTRRARSQRGGVDGIAGPASAAGPRLHAQLSAEHAAAAAAPSEAAGAASARRWRHRAAEAEEDEEEEDEDEDEDEVSISDAAPRCGAVRKRARAASPAAPAAPPPGAAPRTAAAPKRARASDALNEPPPAAATGAAAGLGSRAALAVPLQHDAPGDAAAPVAAFLRAIAPPLSCLHAALAALPESGLSIAHLQCIASSPHASQADRKLLFDELAAVLGITRAIDRVGFMNAVLALAARGGA
jgi:hypothetical protein